MRVPCNWPLVSLLVTVTWVSSNAAQKSPNDLLATAAWPAKMPAIL